MILKETEISGCYLIEPELLEDERGFFTRIYCAEEFAANGLDPTVAQCSMSFNRLRGTLRGMHLQLAPHEEAKLIRCTSGRIYDVIADVRAGSPTANHWAAFELTASNRNAVYAAPGVAHGFLTLEDNCEVLYHISHPYHPESQAGFRWNDPTVGIRWPMKPVVVSERDLSLPYRA